MSDTNEAGVSARLTISGTFQCLDAEGNVLKVIHGSGSFPLSELGLSVEQAQQLIKEQGNGLDNRE